MVNDRNGTSGSSSPRMSRGLHERPRCGLLCFYFVEEVSSFVALFSKASNPSFKAASEVIWVNIQAGTTISRNSAISFFESSSSF